MESLNLRHVDSSYDSSATSSGRSELPDYSMKNGLNVNWNDELKSSRAPVFDYSELAELEMFDNLNYLSIGREAPLALIHELSEEGKGLQQGGDQIFTHSSTNNDNSNSMNKFHSNENYFHDCNNVVEKEMENIRDVCTEGLGLLKKINEKLSENEIINDFITRNNVFPNDNTTSANNLIQLGNAGVSGNAFGTDTDTDTGAAPRGNDGGNETNLECTEGMESTADTNSLRDVGSSAGCTNVRVGVCHERDSECANILTSTVPLINNLFKPSVAKDCKEHVSCDTVLQKSPPLNNNTLISNYPFNSQISQTNVFENDEVFLQFNKNQETEPKQSDTANNNNKENSSSDTAIDDEQTVKNGVAVAVAVDVDVDIDVDATNTLARSGVPLHGLTVAVNAGNAVNGRAFERRLASIRTSESPTIASKNPHLSTKVDVWRRCCSSGSLSAAGRAQEQTIAGEKIFYNNNTNLCKNTNSDLSINCCYNRSIQTVVKLKCNCVKISECTVADVSGVFCNDNVSDIKCQTRIKEIVVVEDKNNIVSDEVSVLNTVLNSCHCQKPKPEDSVESNGPITVCEINALNLNKSFEDQKTQVKPLDLKDTSILASTCKLINSKHVSSHIDTFESNQIEKQRQGRLRLESVVDDSELVASIKRDLSALTDSADAAKSVNGAEESKSVLFSPSSRLYHQRNDDISVNKTNPKDLYQINEQSSTKSLGFNLESNTSLLKAFKSFSKSLIESDDPLSKELLITDLLQDKDRLDLNTSGVSLQEKDTQTESQETSKKDSEPESSRESPSTNIINFEGSSRLKRLEERFKDINKKIISCNDNGSVNTAVPQVCDKEAIYKNILQSHATVEKDPDIKLIPPVPTKSSNETQTESNDNCEPTESERSKVINAEQVLIGDFYTNCEFDVREINNYTLPPDGSAYYECYDELDEDEEDNKNVEPYESNDYDNSHVHGCTSSCLNIIRGCSTQTVPLYKTVVLSTCPHLTLHNTSAQCSKNRFTMRETTSTSSTMVHNKDHSNLKSLLKKPNRSQNGRKNRVVFNENRNEFFDADYIILIREDCGDCPYDDGDDDDGGICTCSDHEMVRVQPYSPCCDEHCNGYDDECTQTPQSPKYAPPLEFVDQATLSPPEGYKDGGLGALGAQHLQQLQIIQKLQAQRNQMLAANRAAAAAAGLTQPVCAECSHQDSDSESRCSADECPPTLTVIPQGPPSASPERRSTLKEIIAGEERPKMIPPHQEDVQSQRYIIETITMTTVTERRIVREAEDAATGNINKGPPDNSGGDRVPNENECPAALSGILKGGRLWKTSNNELPAPQEDTTSFCSDDENSSRRSVRFIEENEGQELTDEDLDNMKEHIDAEEMNQNDKTTSTNEPTEVTLTFKLGSNTSLYSNSLRPNSAVRQLFPANKYAEDQKYLVTSDNLRAFEEAKRSKLLPKENEEEATIRRTIERNALRRSLIKYEPKRKSQQKADTSLEERIRQLTCMDDNEDATKHEERDSPAGEETQEIIYPRPQYLQDKSFSPCSSSSNSSSSSSSSTYKKITDLFSRRQDRHERIPEAPENNEEQNIVIIPQDNPSCKCPSAPDLGNGVQPQPHIQHHQQQQQQQQQQQPHQQPPQQVNPTSRPSSVTSEARKQFLSTLAPLAACVSANHVGGRDDYYYQLSRPGDRISVASSATQCSEYSLDDIDDALIKGVPIERVGQDPEQVAPDVIAGTPGTPGPLETDELAVFVQQDATRIERIKKRYNAEPSTNSGSDDEHDDYGFNRRPSVRGIKPRFGSTTEILQQMQTQLQAPTVAINKNQQWQYYSERDVNHRNSYHEENIYQNVYDGHVGYHMHPPPPQMTGRSPSRGRPESPPPLRNYHHNMVMIPYNNMEAAGYVASPHYSTGAGDVQQQNQERYRRGYPMMEYHQQAIVGQQMIRVPMPHMTMGSYAQVHVVTNRNSRQPQYTPRYPQQRPYSESPPNRQYIENIYENKYHANMMPPGKFAERGAPEGAASSVAQDTYPVTSPTGGPTLPNQNNGPQVPNAAPVYYAMNV